MENEKKNTYHDEFTKDSKEVDKIDKNIKLFTAIAWSLVICGAFLMIIFTCLTVFSNNQIDFKLLIDSIAGIVGTLWSLSSVFFIYVAFLGQKKQLIYQKNELIQNKEELRLNTQELSGQREQLEEQNKTIALQRFENSFFNLLTNLNSIIKDLKIRATKDHQGREVFIVIYSSLLNKSKSFNLQEIEFYLRAYSEVYDTYYGILSHYFRTLYHLFKFIENSKLDEIDKKKYASLVRAQLSSYEQIILFYNCLHVNGNKKFKPLIEKFGLLNNIDNKLLLRKEHKAKYIKSAYE